MPKPITMKVLRWEPRPGQLPAPIIQDDSETFEVEQVKDVRAWLASVAPGYDPTKPSMTVIKLYRPAPGAPIASKTTYGYGNPTERAAGVTVRTCTVGFNWESHDGRMKAQYQYLCAVDDGKVLPGGGHRPPRFILGPCLGVTIGPAPRRAVEVAAPVPALVV